MWDQAHLYASAYCLILPGTDVPGYRLFRPCGTGFAGGSYAEQFLRHQLAAADRQSDGHLEKAPLGGLGGNLSGERAFRWLTFCLCRLGILNSI